MLFNLTPAGLAISLKHHLGKHHFHHHQGAERGGTGGYVLHSKFEIGIESVSLNTVIINGVRSQNLLNLRKFGWL